MSDFAVRPEGLAAPMRWAIVCAFVILFQAGHGAASDAEVKPAAAKKAEPKKAAANKLDQQMIESKLRARTDFTAKQLPLKEVLEKLSELHEIPIKFDEAGLKKAGAAIDKRVTVAIKNYTLNAALNHVLKEYGLHHAVEDGALVIEVGDEPHELEIEIIETGRPPVIRNEATAEAVAGDEAQDELVLHKFRPLLLAELNFVRKVCDPTPEQYRAIQVESEKNLKAVARRHAELQKRNMRRGGPQMGNASSEPHKLIRDSLAKTVKLTLNDEQLARYQIELDQRTKSRREAAVHNLVARLDQDLVLSNEQRDKIAESLLAHWNEAWAPQIEQMVNGSQTYPNVPDRYVAPSLTPAQRKIWTGGANQRNQGVVMVMGGDLNEAGFFTRIFGEEIVWEEDESGPEEKKTDGGEERTE